ncbi:hypothetical protein ZOSMA_472G00040, partial [Zostera marina]
MFNFLLLL